MKTINIVGRVGRFNEKPPFTIADDLKLKFNGLGYGEHYASCKMNGVVVYQTQVKDSELTIEKSLLAPGQLSIEISSQIRGKEVWRRDVEPLVMQALETSYELEPCITSLERQNTALKEKIAELEQSLGILKEELMGELTTLKTELITLVKTSCQDVLFEANKAADENAEILNDKIVEMAGSFDVCFGKILKKKKR